VRGAPPLVELVAAALAKHVGHVPALVAAAGTIVTDLGDLDTPPAVAGLFFGGVRASFGAASTLSEAGSFADGRPALVLSPVRPLEASLGTTAKGLGSGAVGAAVFGDSVNVLDGTSQRSSTMGVVRFDGLCPLLDHAQTSTLLSPPLMVTAMRGGRIVELDGRPAFDAIREHPSSDHGHLVVARGEGDDIDDYEVFSLDGVDPTGGSIHVRTPLSVGDTIRIAEHRIDAWRLALERTTLRMAERSTGAAPRFALYLGGQTTLPSVVDELATPARLTVRRRFGAMPLLGLKTELPVTFDDEGKVVARRLRHVMTLFRSPS
jgi:hypothetical protein